MKNLSKVMLLAGTALTFLLSGCGQSNNSAKGGTISVSSDPRAYAGQTITVVFYYPEPKKAISEFTKKTGIKVNWVNMGWDQVQTKITSSSMAHAYYGDVVLVDWSRVGEFYRTKWFEPLNAYFPEKQLETDISAGKLKAYTVNGSLVALPIDTYVSTTYVNKADFAKAGITKMPGNLDEYTADLKKIQSSGVNPHPLGIPFAAAEALSTTWYDLTAAYGGEVLSSDNKPLFTSPSSPGYKALTWMVNAYKQGLVPRGNINLTDTQVYNQVAQHQVSSMFEGWSGMIGGFFDNPSDSKVIGQVQYIPTPGINGQAPNLYAPDGFGIPKTAKYKGAAVQFLKWFYTPDVQAQLAGLNDKNEDILSLPVSNTALNMMVKANDIEQANTLVNLLQTSAKPVFQNGPPPSYSKFSQAVYTNIHSAALGQETVDQAIQAIAQAASSN